MVGGGDPFYLKFLGQPAPVGAKLPIFAYSASAVTPSETKVQLTLIESPLHAFQ